MYKHSALTIQIVLLSATICLNAASATAQGIVPTKGNVEEAFKRARTLDRPVFVFVPASRNDEEHKRNVKRDIYRAFKNKKIEEFINGRCVDVRMAISSWSKPLREKFGVGSMEAVVVTPDGRVLKKFYQADLCSVETILTGLTEAYHSFTNELYKSRWQACLVDATSPEASVMAALKQIRDRDILAADVDLIPLLDRDLKKATHIEVCRTLAFLSTPKAVSRLLEQALTDDEARRALGKCLPGALNDLAGAMNNEYDTKHAIAYELCCQHLKIRARSRIFWSAQGDKAAREKRAERECVSDRACRAAKEWEKNFGRFR